MENDTMKSRTLLVALALAATPAASVYAGDLIRILPNTPPLGHLFVPVGDGTVGFFLGMRVEPAYVLEPNGVEIYAYADSVYENGDPVDGRFINEADDDPGNPDTHPEDEVKINATIQLLSQEGPDGKVKAYQALGRLLRTNAEVGYYLKEFIPNPAGPYAIRLHGEINGQDFNQGLFCSTDPENHTFSWIEHRYPAVF
jgi:hypothetical protein